MLPADLCADFGAVVYALAGEVLNVVPGKVRLTVDQARHQGAAHPFGHLSAVTELAYSLSVTTLNRLTSAGDILQS